MYKINGIPIMVSEFAVEMVQTKFPRSKRRRIRKKWASRNCNFISRPACYKVKEYFIMHPTMYDAMRRELDKREEERRWV